MNDKELDVMRLHSREEFDIWLAKDIEVREELESMIGSELDINVQSLDTLEAFLLIRYHQPDDALKLDQRGVLDAAARHIGLVMILNIDGTEWDIDLEDKDNAYYRLPIISIVNGPVECPLSLATASLDRRTGDYLRTVIENYEAEYNLTPEGK